MCHLFSASSAGRGRRGGGGGKGGGGEDSPALGPLLTPKGQNPDLPPRGLRAARGAAPLPRPGAPNPGARRVPDLSPLPPPPSRRPQSPGLCALEPRGPHSPRASGARTPGVSGRPGPAYPVGALREPVHLLRPPRHGCSRRAGERGGTRPGLVAARAWAAGRVRGALEGRPPPQPSAAKRRRAGPRQKCPNLQRCGRRRRRQRGAEETRPDAAGASRAGPAAPPEAGGVGGASGGRGAPPEAAGAAGRGRAEPRWAGRHGPCGRGGDGGAERAERPHPRRARPRVLLPVENTWDDRTPTVRGVRSSPCSSA